MSKSLARAFAALLLVLLVPMLLMADPASARAKKSAPPGVVVEEVGKYSATEKAGIKPGDILISWERPANPPASPTPAKGHFQSPFDVREVEISQSPRGVMKLLGLRDKQPLAFDVRPLLWNLTTRPQLDLKALARYLEGKRLAESKDVTGGVTLWRALASDWIESGECERSAWLLSRIGNALFGADRSTDAEKAYEAAIREARKTGNREMEAQVWDLLAELFDGRHDRPRTQEALQHALRIRETEGPGSLPAAESLGNIGNIFDFLEPTAESARRRALAIYERFAPESYSAADTLRLLGITARQKGDLAAAEAFYRRALAIVDKLDPDSLETAKILNNLGVNASHRGDLAAAETFARRALAIRLRLDPEGGSPAASLINLGTLAEKRGESDAAETLYKRALAIWEKLGPARGGTATALQDLGVIELDRGELAKAEEHFRRALAIREKLTPEGDAVPELLENLGEVAHERGDTDAARRSFQRALAIQDKLAPGGFDMSITLERLGDLAAEREQLKEAEEFYRKSLDIRSRLAPGSAVEADAYHGLGMIERKAGRLRDAADLLRNAVGALELQKGKLGGPEEAKSSFAAKYADYYRDYIKVLIELNQREDAFKTLERFRARALLARLAERDLVFSADVPPALERERKLADAEYDRTQNQIRELNPKEHATQVDELLSHLRELRTSRDEIAQKIKKASPRYASLQYPQPLDLAGTLAALDPGTLLLSYCVGKEKSYVFVVSSDPKRGPPLSVITIASGEKALRESVEAFRKLIEWNKPSPDLVSRGRSLYDALIKPAEGLIGKADRILILPDGPLHTLPWGALVRDVKGRKPRCLIEWKPLHTAVSATVYAELKRSRREKATPAPSIAIAAFGDPKYLNLPVKTGTKRGSEEENKDTESAEDIADPEVRLVVRGGHRFDPLPATRKEVETIVSLYVPRAKTFLGEQATEERAKSIGKDIPLIHFACHAFVNERFPLDSGLALTIPEKPKEAQDNGLLQAWEIFEKVRIDADLVTLSACESGLGKEMGGEGLIGLARAFQYAGARAVLASLWKVEDQSTGELMKRFYSYLKAGKTKDEALRLAQIDLIHSPDLAQPIHWAAFQLIGDWK